MKRVKGFVLAGLCLVVWGCARYEYAVIQPEQFAGRIGNAPAVVEFDPMQYRLESAGNQLAITLVNPTEDPIRLVGQRSYAVDPRGLSHPLRGKTIGPHSYVPIFLPPSRQVFGRSPPSGYFGWGMGFGNPFWYNNYSHFHPYYGYYQPWVYDPWDPYYAQQVPLWEWKTGEVNLRLFYEREDDTTFDHRFKFTRQKVD